jgi:hypothetical protein
VPRGEDIDAHPVRLLSRRWAGRHPDLRPAGRAGGRRRRPRRDSFGRCSRRGEAGRCPGPPGCATRREPGRPRRPPRGGRPDRPRGGPAAARAATLVSLVGQPAACCRGHTLVWRGWAGRRTRPAPRTSCHGASRGPGGCHRRGRGDAVADQATGPLRDARPAGGCCRRVRRDQRRNPRRCRRRGDLHAGRAAAQLRSAQRAASTAHRSPAAHAWSSLGGSTASPG